VKKKTKTINKKQKKQTSKNLKENIQKLESDIEDLKNKNIRLLAEFDNFKKRNMEERRQILQYDGKDFIVNILPVLDDLDRTLSIKELKNNKNIYSGIKMIIDKINKILDDKGVKSYKSVGEAFDTSVHEALMMKKSNKKSGLVLEEFEKGYLYHDKVIRHAKVIVSE
tara:strand:+ start:161 stop:664 length:504 start_codon:yes stop_codon:yes gene_type:complete